MLNRGLATVWTLESGYIKLLGKKARAEVGELAEHESLPGSADRRPEGKARSFPMKLLLRV